MAYEHAWFWILILQLGLAVLAGWAVSYGLTRLSIRLALRFDVVARPNTRTSHEGVVPRIGGIGPAGAFLLAMAGVGIWMGLSGGADGGGEAGAGKVPILVGPVFWSLLAGGAGAFLLGLWDDVRSLSAGVKLVAQVLLALAPPLLGLRLERFGLPGMGPWEIPALLGGAAAFAWILFWMNAYNFMDGINGIAGRFGEIMAFSMMLMFLLVLGAARVEAYLLAFLGGACFGFLGWNFPTARTFLGDCGSQFLGYLLAVWTLHLAAEVSPVKAVFPAMIALTLPFAWDVVYTLIRRATRGENLLVAHRSHLYQRLMSTGLSHAETLAVCEKTFQACAVASVVVVIFSTSRFIPLQWGGLAASIVAMAAYTRYVRSRERSVSSGADSTGNRREGSSGANK